MARIERLLGYTQLATLLPLAYIVGSAFLGSRILKGAGPRAINILWLAFTVVACLAAVFLAARGVHESRALSRAAFVTDESRRPADFYQRVGVRLGLSAALLTLVAVFMLLNLFSVLGDLDSVLTARYVL
ncbi:MAG: hypothetical protein LLG24_07780 [Actinomycetia bacterium]|nr:hypothetical protein [Actinomycetes bacterium]